MEKFKEVIRKIFLLPIRGYQKFISPLFPATCRFYPTCSEYFVQAVKKYGIFKGSYLGIKRILKCNPWSKDCGYDPLK